MRYSYKKIKIDSSFSDLVQLYRIAGYLFKFIQYFSRFSDYANKILGKNLNIFIIKYLDNIIIYTKNSS